MRDAVADYISLAHDIEEKTQARQTALDKLFGLTHWTQVTTGRNGLQRVTQGSELPPGPGFDSLQEAFEAFSGDPHVLKLGQRITQASTLDFPKALANTMNNLLLKAYGEVDYRLRDIVTSTTSAPNFKALERTRIKSVEDLEEIPEDAPYEEVGNSGDEGYSFAVATWGGFLTVTRHAVLANNVQGIQRAVEQLARAAARTLAKRCWDKVISNRAYGVDDLAMFHTDHANLGAAALSVAALNAARLAMFAQTEPGSDERLGLSGPFLLVVPVELEATARGINNCQYVPGSETFEANPWYQRFGPAGERIFANPLFTDTDDWCLFDTSGKVGILEIAFLLGKQNPTIQIADDPREGATFSQDRITYKLRHEYEVAIEDYRGAYKAVVT